MRALKNVRVRFMDREVGCTALFDMDSGHTVIQRAFFEKSFGANWSKLPKPIRLYLVDGDFVEADKYAQAIIIVDDVELLPPEVILIVDRFVEEVEVEGRRVKLPELIIGSGAVDKYGITLDPKEGVKLTGATLLL